MFDKALKFWRKYGTRALIWRLRGELSKRLGRHQNNLPMAQVSAPVPLPSAGNRWSATGLVAHRFSALTPLPCFELPPSLRKRVNIVTDSINAGSLFGGVGTALILATLLANRMGANLRIITRTEPSHTANLDHLLTVYGLKLNAESEFVFMPSHASRQSFDFSVNDVFITTSWWTTAATLGAIPPRLVYYLLQEDERMFYPYGDDRVECEQVLQRTDLKFVINTKLLYDHLTESGMPHLTENGIWFEPAFPSSVYYPRMHAARAKRRFVFYARPNNLRNLFYLGIRVIDAAISKGILDPEQWDIVLMGKDIPDIEFATGVIPTRLENLSWSQYSELVGTVDLGLSLMATPHPSYPPLDMAASGAVVVTNSFGIKQDLAQYSPNLLCAKAELGALLAALEEGALLAQDAQRRARNLDNSGLGRDWELSLRNVLADIDGAR